MPKLFKSAWWPFPTEFREFASAAPAAGGSDSGESEGSADGNSDDDWMSPWDSGDMIGATGVRDGYKLPSMHGFRMISLSDPA